MTDAELEPVARAIREAERTMTVPALHGSSNGWNGETIVWFFAGEAYPSMAEAKEAQLLAVARISARAAIDAWNRRPSAQAVPSAEEQRLVGYACARPEAAAILCHDGPAVGYPTDKTRCDECPRHTRRGG